MKSRSKTSAAEFFTEGERPWARELMLNENGTPKAQLANVLVPLTKDPVFSDRHGRSLIRYDQLSGDTVACGPLPWDASITLPRAWSKHDDQELTVWLQDNDINVKGTTIAMAVSMIGERNQYHPVREYLDSLSWDGKARVDVWLAYCGLQQISSYVSMVGERWMISAVARVKEPGCRADGMLVLKGKHDLRQVSPFKVLGGQFHSSQVEAIGIKTVKGMILGKWILEVDGLDKMSKPLDSLRDYVSLRSDKVGAFLGHKVAIWPRQCVFCGLLSNDSMMISPNEQMWLVRHGELRTDELERDRDQLWAEARERYADGLPWIFDSDLSAAMTEARKEFRLPDQWESIIMSKQSELAISDRGVGVNDLLALLGVPVQKRTTDSAARLAIVMQSLGWERRMVDGFWRYFPK